MNTLLCIYVWAWSCFYAHTRAGIIAQMCGYKLCFEHTSAYMCVGVQTSAGHDSADVYVNISTQLSICVWAHVCAWPRLCMYIHVWAWLRPQVHTRVRNKCCCTVTLLWKIFLTANHEQATHVTYLVGRNIHKNPRHQQSTDMTKQTRKHLTSAFPRCPCCACQLHGNRRIELQHCCFLAWISNWMWMLLMLLGILKRAKV